jgi:hypothetical protein
VEAGSGFAQLFACCALLWPYVHLGRGEQALAVIDLTPGLRTPQGYTTTGAALRAFALAHLGRLEDARVLLADLRSRGALADQSVATTRALVVLLAAAVLVGDRAAAAVLRSRLAPLADLCSDWAVTCVARHLGSASALLGERAAARSFYERALVLGERLGFRSELALTRIALAELLMADGGDHACREARQQLEIAIPELRAMRMDPALERAGRVVARLESGAR